MLDHDAIDAYAPMEPANGRMRAIMDDIFGQHLEQNLWIPAAMPYYGAAIQRAADQGADLFVLVHGAGRDRRDPVLRSRTAHGRRRIRPALFRAASPAPLAVRLAGSAGWRVCAPCC
jgi:hypothetical protein